MKERKKGKTGPPAAGETPVLPKEDIPSLEDLLRGLGGKREKPKGDARERAKDAKERARDVKERAQGTVRRVPGQARPRTNTPPPLPSVPPSSTPSTPEPFTTAQKHVFERRPSYEQLEQPEVNYEQLEQSEVSYEQAPSADELAPRLERVPQYTNEAGEVDYEDPKRAAYAGLDSRKPRFEPFETERKRVSPYAQLLRNPQSAREAFILTEIFRRKY
ncbi:MAG: hypothetical protein ICV83_01180 [Cytophagales bacterium]|nr:hypothetical protein [Cytophagales bacterium]